MAFSRGVLEAEVLPTTEYQKIRLRPSDHHDEIQASTRMFDRSRLVESCLPSLEQDPIIVDPFDQIFH